MVRVFIFLSVLLSSISIAESLNHGGQKYEVEVNETTLDCEGFGLSLVKRSLPFSINESKIPYDITMGHYDSPHLLSQSFTYISGEVKNQQDSITLLPTYERIDPSRSYIAKAVSCVSDNSVTVSFWGGGNCKDICEAWSLVTFSKVGKVVSSKGLTYPEFKQYN